MKTAKLGSLIIVALLFLSVGISHATQIIYTPVNLPDSTPGVDLWQYSYSVSGFSFNADTGFTVLFDETQYSDLTNPTANADWDPIALQPDLGLPAPGAYDALALVNGASLSSPFTVDFTWLGAGIPGSQPFEVYSLDASGGLTILESGQTAPVPEPATLLLLGSGLGGLAFVRKRMKVLRS